MGYPPAGHNPPDPHQYGTGPHNQPVPYGQPPAYGPQGYQPPVHYVTGPPTSGTAVASLIFGLIGILGGWCAFGIPCLIAVVLGHAAMKETKSGAKSGHGLAVAGLILGYFVVIPAVILSIMLGIGGIGVAIENP